MVAGLEEAGLKSTGSCEPEREDEAQEVGSILGRGGRVRLGMEGRAMGDRAERGNWLEQKAGAGFSLGMKGAGHGSSFCSSRVGKLQFTS